MIISSVVKAPALFLACLPAVVCGQPSNDLTRGQKLYENHCSLCHGQTGLGGKGPSLVRPTLPRAPDLDSLTEVIKKGIAGTEMPGSWQLTDNEANQVAQYVRGLGRTAVVKVPGDPERGRAIYENKGKCGSCHIVRGSGASFGPELTDVGARRSPDYLRQTLLNPGASVPENFLVVRVTTRDGKTIRGIRVNEDTFTLQLRDSSNRFYSFRKSSLANIEKQFKQSLMPAFGSVFTPDELDDLVAYLASLRGES